MPNFIDNIDLFDADNNPTNILLKDRNSLALATEGLAKANTALSKLSNLYIYNVKEYGALGDGETDDTSAINLAIADYNSTGGILYFPNSYYIVGGTLTPLTKSGLVLGDSSIIDATSNSDTDFTLITISASHVTIDSLQIYGGTNGTAIKTSARSTVKNCVISGFNTQVYIFNSTVTKIYNNYFVNFGVSISVNNPQNTDAGDHMIYGNTWDTSNAGSGTAILVTTSGGLYITSNKFLNCAYAFVEGITTDATSVLLFNNNSVETTNGLVFNSPLTGTRFSKVTINNNEFALSQYGMQILDDTEGIIINGNYLEGVGTNSCIFLGTPNSNKAPAKVTISDNVFHNFSSAIYMYNNIDKCNVDNNTFNDVQYPINSGGITEISGDNIFSIKLSSIVSASGDAFRLITANSTTFKLIVKLSGSHADYGEYQISVVNSTPTFTPLIQPSGNISVSMGTTDIVIRGVTVSSGDVISIESDGLLILAQKY